MTNLNPSNTNSLLGGIVLLSLLLCLLMWQQSQTSKRAGEPTSKRTSTPYLLLSITPITGQDHILLGHKIDINTATPEMLDALPGIGPSLARKIVEHRKMHGPFVSVDELDKVPGIGPKKLAQVREWVK